MGFTNASFLVNIFSRLLLLLLCFDQKFNCNYFRVVFVSRASITEKDTLFKLKVEFFFFVIICNLLQIQELQFLMLVTGW